MLTVSSIVAAVVALPTPPAAAAGCSWDAGTKTVTLPPGGGTVSSDDSGGPPTLCGQTFDQISTVVWPGTPGDDTFVFDVVGGTFTPGASSDPDGSPEIKFQLDAGGGSDTVKISGISSLTYHIVTTSAGIDLNGDGDVDATITNAEHLDVRLGAGADTVDASSGLPAGMDGMTVEAGSNDDTIDGSPGDDTLYYDGSDGTIDAGPGDDTVILRNEFWQGGLETPSFDGGPGVDTLRWDALGTGASADLATGTVVWSYPSDASGSLTGFENLVGGSQTDTLIGDDGDNLLDAGAGVGDVLQGRGGNDTLMSEGSGAWASFEDAAVVTVELSAGSATGDGDDDLIGIANVIGSPGRDTIDGADDRSGEIIGEEGNDTILGGAEADLLIGGPGNDRISGGGGSDEIHGGRGSDLLIGGAGDDELSGSSGSDVLQGGPGADRWNPYLPSVAPKDQHPVEGVVVDLAEGIVRDDGFGTSDTVQGIEDASGTSFADTLIGNGGNNRLYGSSGNDRLVGGSGDDHLGGAMGRDTVSYASASRPIRLDLRANGSTGQGHDRLFGIEVVIGGPEGDTLRGSAGDDRLEGHAGADVLAGRGGRDALVAGPGADRLSGGDGLDVCNGGAGVDAASECETVWRVP